MKIIKFLILFLVLFSFTSLVLAQPKPFEPAQVQFNGLFIEYPPFQYYQLGDINFFYHVYDINGTPTITPTCRFHLYNQTNHIYQDNNVSIALNGLEYVARVNESYFKLGEIYTVIFDCYTANEGGFVAKGIKITEDGTDNREGQTGGSALIIILGLIFVGLIFVSLVFDNPAFKVGTGVLAVGILPLILNITEKIINISYPYSLGRLMVEESLNKLSSLTSYLFLLYLVFAVVYMIIYFFNKFSGSKTLPTPYDEEMGDLKKW